MFRNLTKRFLHDRLDNKPPCSNTSTHPKQRTLFSTSKQNPNHRKKITAGFEN